MIEFCISQWALTSISLNGVFNHMVAFQENTFTAAELKKHEKESGVHNLFVVILYMSMIP